MDLKEEAAIGGDPAIHDIERAALFGVNRFAGVTAFCLAEKQRAA